MSMRHDRAFAHAIGSGTANPYQSHKMAAHGLMAKQAQAWGVENEVEMGATCNKPFGSVEKRRLAKAARPFWHKRRQCWVTPSLKRANRANQEDETSIWPQNQTWSSARGGDSSRESGSSRGSGSLEKEKFTAHIFEDRPDMNVTLG
jgi:hypothetical protein